MESWNRAAVLLAVVAVVLFVLRGVFSPSSSSGSSPLPVPSSASSSSRSATLGSDAPDVGGGGGGGGGVVDISQLDEEYALVRADASRLLSESNIDALLKQIGAERAEPGNAAAAAPSSPSSSPPPASPSVVPAARTDDSNAAAATPPATHGAASSDSAAAVAATSGDDDRVVQSALSVYRSVVQHGSALERAIAARDAARAAWQEHAVGARTARATLQRTVDAYRTARDGVVRAQDELDKSRAALQRLQRAHADAEHKLHEFRRGTTNRVRCVVPVFSWLGGPWTVW